MDKTEKKNSLAYSALLLLAALIWGSAFVAQSVGMDYIGPFTFGAVRNTIGFLVLLPVSYFSRRYTRRAAVSAGGNLSGATGSGKSRVAGRTADKSSGKTTSAVRQTLIAGLVCGVVLCSASSFQQAGIAYTTVGKSGFITAMYIVIVPVLGIFLKKKTTWRTWVAVLLAVTGLYLLCIKAGDMSLGYGDLLMLACAFLFAVHILVVDHYMNDGGSEGSEQTPVPETADRKPAGTITTAIDPVTLSCVQFGVTALIQTVIMFIFEEPRIDAIIDAMPSILYAGVLSSGVAFTLQIITQKHLAPVVAALIMSMESVFSVLSGWVILGERMSVRETVGCVLMFSAIILAQLPGKKIKVKEQKNEIDYQQ